MRLIFINPSKPVTVTPECEWIETVKCVLLTKISLVTMSASVLISDEYILADKTYNIKILKKYWTVLNN